MRNPDPKHFCGGKVAFSKNGETALEAADRVQREVKAYKAAKPDYEKKTVCLRTAEKTDFGKGVRVQKIHTHDADRYRSLHLYWVKNKPRYTCIPH